MKLESTLRWNLSTEYIAGKACSKVGFIIQTISSALKHLGNKAYTTLAHPFLKYASSVWDSYATGTLAKHPEDIQRKAACMDSNFPRTDHKTSTTALIKEFEWQSLSDRCQKRRLGLLRAMYFDKVATNTSDFLKPQTSTVGYSRRHNKQYAILHARTKHHINSCFILTAKAWNSLPVTSTLLVGPPTLVVG